MQACFLKMISSDGHRLTIMEKESSVDLNDLQVPRNTIIPRKGIVEIKKFSEGEEKISIGLEQKQIVFKNDDSIIIIRLMNGEFPDYRSILDGINRDNFIDIDRVQFLESLRRS